MGIISAIIVFVALFILWVVLPTVVIKKRRAEKKDKENDFYDGSKGL